MKEHRHARKNVNSAQCACGVTICAAVHPTKMIGCVLEEGHLGPHHNGWVSDLMSWDDDGVEVDLSESVL